MKFEQTDMDEYELEVYLEGEFESYVYDDNDGRLRVRFRTSGAIELYDAVVGELRGYIAERDAVKALYDRGLGPDGGPSPADTDAERELLDPSDPHHPDYAESVRASVDRARKAQKENQ